MSVGECCGLAEAGELASTPGAAAHSCSLPCPASDVMTCTDSKKLQ